jgi:hypothetical protein
MPPKNPVRAARQAGRQQVRAAKDTRRENVQAVRTATKVAKIQTRTANKVGRISGTSAKTTGIQPQQATKSTASSSSKIAPKQATKSGLTGKDLLTYGVKPKAPVAKGPSYAPFKTPADQKKSQQMTADAKRRAAEAATRKMAPAPKAAPKKTAPKKEKTTTKKNDGYGYVSDMFLGPGETRENTLPYTFTNKAKTGKRNGGQIKRK